MRLSLKGIVLASLFVGMCAITLNLFSEEASKFEVPDEARIEEVKSLLRDVLPKEFADYKAQKITKSQLADVILKQEEVAEEDVSRYVILTWAQSIYVKDKNYLKAIGVVTKLGEHFKDIDVNGQRLELLQKCLSESKRADYSMAMATFNAVLAERISAQDDAQCAQYIALMKKYESKYGKTEEFATYKELVRTLKEENSVRKFLNEKEKALKQDPDNPTLNREYAEALVRVDGNWAKALPHFAKGDHPDLKNVATFELGKNKKLKPLQVGDVYWTLGEQSQDDLAREFKVHAGVFYARALKNVKGLKRALIEKKLADIEQIKASMDETSKKRDAQIELPATRQMTHKEVMTYISRLNEASNPITGPGKILHRFFIEKAKSRYISALLLQDGNVLLIPANGFEILVYSPSENKIMKRCLGEGNYRGGVLLPNGNAVLLPNGSTRVCVYSPTENKIIQRSEPLIGSEFFNGGVLLPDGKVLMSPATYPYICVYDPEKNTVEDQVNIGDGVYKHMCMLSPTNPDEVILIPDCVKTLLVYNYKTRKITKTSQVEPYSIHKRGIYLPDGTIFLAELYKKYYEIYVPKKNKMTQEPFEKGLGGGTLLPNGQLCAYCAHETGYDIHIYSPKKKKILQTLLAFKPSEECYTTLLLPNGDVFFLVGGGEDCHAIVYRPDYKKKVNVPKGVVESPFFNRR